MSTQDDQGSRNNRIIRRANAVVGMLVGAFVGLCVGLELLTRGPHVLLFPGDTVAVGVLICGYGGYRFGEPFIDRVVELWKSLR